MKYVFAFCDINYKKENSLLKKTNKNNYEEYLYLCKVCSEDINSLLGEAFILTLNSVSYINLFCLKDNIFDEKALTTSLSYVLPKINFNELKSITTEEKLIEQNKLYQKIRSKANEKIRNKH